MELNKGKSLIINWRFTTKFRVRNKLTPGRVHYNNKALRLCIYLSGGKRIIYK